MAMKNSQAVAQKWSRNVAANVESIRAGVQGTTTNPAEKAAARQDAYVSGVQQAAATGKYRRGLAKVTLQSWQDAMITKGLPRVASGASAAQPKMAAFLDKFLPYLEQGKQKLASMPRGDLNTNIQRMVTMVQHNADFKM